MVVTRLRYGTSYYTGATVWEALQWIENNQAKHPELCFEIRKPRQDSATFCVVDATEDEQAYQQHLAFQQELEELRVFHSKVLSGTFLQIQSRKAITPSDALIYERLNEHPGLRCIVETIKEMLCEREQRSGAQSQPVKSGDDDEMEPSYTSNKSGEPVTSAWGVSLYPRQTAHRRASMKGIE